MVTIPCNSSRVRQGRLRMYPGRGHQESASKLGYFIFGVRTFHPMPFQPLPISTYTNFGQVVPISYLIILDCFHFHTFLKPIMLLPQF